MIKFSDIGTGQVKILWVSLGLKYIRPVPGILRINKGADNARG